MNTNLVLASASERRSELLKKMGLDFKVVPSNINENKFNNLPGSKLVQKLAKAKVENVADLISTPAIIIGADTVVEYENKILGKPDNKIQAEKMIKLLENTNHQVLTGLAVLSTEDDNILVNYDETEVFMCELSKKEIDNYIKTGEPFDKAGAYGIQGKAGIFIEKIVGSYFTVMGLPLHLLHKMLKKFSVEIL